MSADGKQFFVQIYKYTSTSMMIHMKYTNK